MEYLFLIAASLWLVVLVVALHRSQAPHVRSWWQTGSWAVQFLFMLFLVMQPVLPPQPQGWYLLSFLIVVVLLPFLVLFDATRRQHRVPEESSPEPRDTGLARPRKVLDR